MSILLLCINICGLYDVKAMVGDVWTPPLPQQSKQVYTPLIKISNISILLFFRVNEQLNQWLLILWWVTILVNY